MATDKNQPSENNDWSWSSWISSAKEKSLAALSATSRDLAEFVTVVQGDTTSAVTDAATKVKQIINKDQDNDDQDGGEDVDHSTTKSTSSGSNKNEDSKEDGGVYDRSLTHLELMRSDPSTYCTVPEGKSAEFLQWSQGFDLSNQQEEISKLLVASTNIRKLHSTLVPAKVSYESFWYNYFYRIHLLDKTEAHRAEIMARVHSQGQLICWDDDEMTEENPDDVILAKRNFNKTTTTDERAMTDSSESFVCINEEETPPLNEDDPVINEEADLVMKTDNEEAELVMKTDKTLDRKENESDDDWEKWSDS